MQVLTRGEEWELLLGRRLRSDWGQCNYTKRRILISQRAKAEIELDTIIHEVLHAGFHDLDEIAVNEIATDLARILTTLGYAKQTAS